MELVVFRRNGAVSAYVDPDVIGSGDHALQQARLKLLGDRGYDQEGGEPAAVVFAGEYARSLREPLYIARLKEVCRCDEEVLDVARGDGLDSVLAGVESGEVREVVPEGSLDRST